MYSNQDFGHSQQFNDYAAHRSPMAHDMDTVEELQADVFNFLATPTGIMALIGIGGMLYRAARLIFTTEDR